jgi:hypothetical protein
MQENSRSMAIKNNFDFDADTNLLSKISPISLLYYLYIALFNTFVLHKNILYKTLKMFQYKKVAIEITTRE